MINTDKIQALIYKFSVTIGMLPTSFKNSLTYEEQLFAIHDYIENTLVPALNLDREAITEIQNLFLELQDYVNNYFDNLDVQNEINKKLDKMYENGTLQELVNPYFSEFEEETNNRINNFINYNTQKLNDFNNKIKNFNSPKDVFETYNDLVNSNSTNTENIYIVLETNKWYYFNDNTSLWTAGGDYQSAVTLIDTENIYDGAVTKPKLSNRIFKNGFWDKFNCFASSDTNMYAPITQSRAADFLEPTATGIKSILSSNINFFTFITNTNYQNNGYPKFTFSQSVNNLSSSGFLAGFYPVSENSVTNNIYQRILIGYEPVYGFVLYYNYNFYTLEDKVNILQDTYNFKFEKNSKNKCIVTITGTSTNYSKTFDVTEYLQNINFKEYTAFTLNAKVKDVNITLDDLVFEDNDVIDGNKIIDGTIDSETLSANKSIIYNNFGKQTGRNVHIYQFGGKGNNWCFVRTPENYDPLREKSFPFVICNHGNGWTMDGTSQKANWTKRTMYVEATDTDYIANPTQYNLVPENHPEYLYSNPTIEALLSAGYIVCGCENYGDNLYGNNDCRNACVDFFYHMINNYNVEKRCYMIGASNGAMTSLNALYLLQDKIKAMILQYPLTCLYNQYVENDNHKSQIKNVYNLPDNVTENEFYSLTRTHDPLNVNTINNKKLGYFPPSYFYYSLEDTVTKATANTLPLFELLDNSNLECFKKEVSGEHGDYTNFEPANFVTFFNNYL